MATQDVTTFVQALKDFRKQLPSTQQAMLDHIIASAQQDDTAGYYFKRRTEQPPMQNDDTAGYGFRHNRTETGQEDDTTGYAGKGGTKIGDQPEMDVSDAGARVLQDDELWTRLTTWLSQDDDTAGYARWR